MLLRVVVCAACAFLAVAEHEAGGKGGWKIGLIITALAFNPLVPLSLTREVWAVLNVAVAIFLLGHLRERRRAIS